MSIVKNIGKNTVGDNGKMSVDLRTYNRSTHNMSRAWRSSMGVGTLVPCFKELALPGDTFDIRIANKVLTHPTVGPLFGSYKLQVDFFTCPIRLYNAMLHNNALGIGLDMSKVKVPQWIFKDIRYSERVDPNKFFNKRNVAGSSILAYLGSQYMPMNPNSGVSTGQIYNGLPILMYQDIFKNYYANKQEKNYYWISGQKGYKTASLITGAVFEAGNDVMTKGEIQTSIETNTRFSITGENGFSMSFDEITKYFTLSITPNVGTKMTLKNGMKINLKSRGPYFKTFEEGLILNNEPLESIDNVRELILKAGKEVIKIDENFTTSKYLKETVAKGAAATDPFFVSNPNHGLILKTLNSDIFNNWVSNEWVEGTNGINEITAVDTSGGSFNIDTLNLAQKVYNMLNRIAVSGGTYKDWIQTVYTSEGYGHVETPIYEGGTSAEIQFEEVVSVAETGDQPLGTLGGRGIGTGTKGGELHIKIEEPSYIIGIASITPRVDYSQGIDWDMQEIKTMNDLHKPALDGIGYQDLLLCQAAGWVNKNVAIGKTVAWINYMTSYNKALGNFAAGENEDFMCLNRIYSQPILTADGKTVNTTTYINPTDYINQFAEKSLTSQDFWVQLGFEVEARRVMSAKQIPNI